MKSKWCQDVGIFVSQLTTKEMPAACPRSGGQGLSAANAMRYAAKTPPPSDKKPKPVEDLGNQNWSNHNKVANIQ